MSAHAGTQLKRGDATMLTTMRRIQAPIADLQRQLADRLPEVRRAGTPRLSSETVDALVDRALTMCDERRHLGSRPVTELDAQALRSAAPRLIDHLATLEATVPLVTVQHLDLHHGNVFVDDLGSPRILDWGDARVGSPSLHLISTVSLLGFITGLETRDPRIGAVVDAYLAAWPEKQFSRSAAELLHDPRLAAFVRMDALVSATHAAPDDSMDPFADWLPDIVRASGASSPAAAVGVRLA